MFQIVPKIIILFYTFFCFKNMQAYGFLTTGESAEITRPNEYRIGIQPQILFSNYIGSHTGGNLDFFADRALNEEMSWRALLGMGATEFYTGGSLKWVPIPDLENQPAVGLKFETLIGRQSSESFLALRVHPIISKKFDSAQGTWIPFAAFPLGWYSYSKTSFSMLQMVVGTEFFPLNIPQWFFSTELGFNVQNSISYFAATASFYWEEVRRKKNY